LECQVKVFIIFVAILEESVVTSFAAMATGVAEATAVTQVSVEARRNLSVATPRKAFSSSVCTCMRWH
jgi:hypothetical protein